MIHINSNDNTPLYRQVIDQVKLMVMSGQCAPGDQLESVSSLSARLKVNPMTISKAYSILVSEGTAERRQGVGIFVAAISEKKADKERQLLLDTSLKEAAGLVVQLDVPRERATKIFDDYIKAFSRKKGSQQS